MLIVVSVAWRALCRAFEGYQKFLGKHGQGRRKNQICAQNKRFCHTAE